jgi:hypothetical protein
MRISVRNMRILAAVALGAAVIWATAPYATSYVSPQAVVNAPLNTVLSPMKGHGRHRGPFVPLALVAIFALARPDRLKDHRIARYAVSGALGLLFLRYIAWRLPVTVLPTDQLDIQSALVWILFVIEMLAWTVGSNTVIICLSTTNAWGK